MNSQDLMEMFKALIKEIEAKEEIIDKEEEAEFQKARRVVGKTILFRNDDLYNDYKENVAMTLYNEQRNNDNCLLNFSEPEIRNKIADKILESIFSKGIWL